MYVLEGYLVREIYNFKIELVTTSGVIIYFYASPYCQTFFRDICFVQIQSDVNEQVGILTDMCSRYFVLIYCME